LFFSTYTRFVSGTQKLERSVLADASGRVWSDRRLWQFRRPRSAGKEKVELALFLLCWLIFNCMHEQPQLFPLFAHAYSYSTTSFRTDAFGQADYSLHFSHLLRSPAVGSTRRPSRRAAPCTAGAAKNGAVSGFTSPATASSAGCTSRSRCSGVLNCVCLISPFLQSSFPV